MDIQINIIANNLASSVFNSVESQMRALGGASGKLAAGMGEEGAAAKKTAGEVVNLEEKLQRLGEGSNLSKQALDTLGAQGLAPAERKTAELAKRVDIAQTAYQQATHALDNFNNSLAIGPITKADAETQKLLETNKALHQEMVQGATKSLDEHKASLAQIEQEKQAKAAYKQWDSENRQRERQAMDDARAYEKQAQTETRRADGLERGAVEAHKQQQRWLEKQNKDEARALEKRAEDEARNLKKAAETEFTNWTKQNNDVLKQSKASARQAEVAYTKAAKEEEKLASKQAAESEKSDIRGVQDEYAKMMIIGVEDSFFKNIAGKAHQYLQSITTAAGNQQFATAKLQIAASDSHIPTATVSKAITDMAGNSLFSSEQIAAGYERLVERGVSLKDILGGVGKAVVHLAQATGTDMVQAADTLGVSMREMGQDASSANANADALTASFYKGLPSLTEQEQGLRTMAPLAREVGWSFNDTLGIITQLGGAMGSGSQAGTALRYALKAIADPTDKASEGLERMGLVTVNKTSPAIYALQNVLRNSGAAGETAANSYDGSYASLNALWKAGTRIAHLDLGGSFNIWAKSTKAVANSFYDANGHFVNTIDFLEKLQKGIKGLPTQQDKITAIDGVFNTKQGAGIATLIQDDKGVQLLKEIIAAEGQVGNATDKSNTLLNTQNGAFQQLGTTWQTFLANTGSYLTDFLQGGANKLNDFVSVIGAKASFLGPASIVFASLALSFSGIGIAFGVIQLATLPMFAALLPYVATFATVVGSVLLIISSISIIAGDIASRWKEWSKPNNAMYETVQRVKEVFEHVRDTVGGMLAGVFKSLGDYFQSNLKPIVENIVKNLGSDGMQGVLIAIGALFSAGTWAVGGVVLTAILLIAKTFEGITGTIKLAGEAWNTFHRTVDPNFAKQQDDDDAKKKRDKANQKYLAQQKDNPAGLSDEIMAENAAITDATNLTDKLYTIWDAYHQRMKVNKAEYDAFQLQARGANAAKDFMASSANYSKEYALYLQMLKDKEKTEKYYADEAAYYRKMGWEEWQIKEKLALERLSKQTEKGAQYVTDVELAAQIVRLTNARNFTTEQMKIISDAYLSQIDTTTDNGKLIAEAFRKGIESKDPAIFAVGLQLAQSLYNGLKVSNVDAGKAAAQAIADGAASHNYVLKAVGEVLADYLNKGFSVKPDGSFGVPGWIVDSNNRIVQTGTTTATSYTDNLNKGFGSPPTTIGVPYMLQPNTYTPAVTTLNDNMTKWGKDAGNNFAQGLIDSQPAVASAAQTLANTIAGPLKHSVPSQGPLKDDNLWMVHLGDNMVAGLLSSVPRVHRAATTIAQSIKDGLQTPNGTALQASYEVSAQTTAAFHSATTTVPLNIDGKAVASIVVDRLTGQLRQAGIGRSMR